MENCFWTHSWKSISREKVSSFVEHLDYSIDPIIQFLQKREIASVCDAGCGCGVYSRKLAMHGFMVSGFDVSEDAVALTKNLLSEKGYPTQDFRTADILATEYADGQFDAVVCRDVIDHMPIEHGIAAVAELLRIVRPGGCALLTLDETDCEYESEPHSVNDDGDYLFLDGKWKGMVFHPYTKNEIGKLTAEHNVILLESHEAGFTVVVEKQ